MGKSRKLSKVCYFFKIGKNDTIQNNCKNFYSNSEKIIVKNENIIDQIYKEKIIISNIFDKINVKNIEITKCFDQPLSLEKNNLKSKTLIIKSGIKQDLFLKSNDRQKSSNTKERVNMRIENLSKEEGNNFVGIEAYFRKKDLKKDENMKNNKNIINLEINENNLFTNNKNEYLTHGFDREFIRKKGKNL